MVVYRICAIILLAAVDCFPILILMPRWRRFHFFFIYFRTLKWHFRFATRKLIESRLRRCRLENATELSNIKGHTRMRRLELYIYFFSLQPTWRYKVQSGSNVDCTIFCQSMGMLCFSSFVIVHWRARPGVRIAWRIQSGILYVFFLAAKDSCFLDTRLKVIIL